MAILTQNQIGSKISFGRMTVMNGYTGATFPVTATLQEVSTANSLSVAWVLSSNSSDFSLPSDGNLTYTGIKPRVFMVDYSITSNAGTRIQVALYKNGSLAHTTYGQGLSETGARGQRIDLVNGDDLTLWIAQAAGSGTLTIYFGQLSVWSQD